MLLKLFVRQKAAWRVFLFLSVAAGLFIAATASAQFPGMDAEISKPATNAPATAAPQPVAAVAATPVAGTGHANFYSPLVNQWNRYLGPESPYRGLILTVLTLIVLLNLKAYLTRVMRVKVEAQAFKEENAKSFFKVWNVTWKFVITVLVLLAMSGSLKLLGLTAGFFGMMLGWSLQQPVTGIAAWLMIILKKPFRIGDRVIIAGITGDVTGISLTHVVLNQVGGSIGGEEKSGRGILIPNAILFQNIIINYTLDQKFMLDEVPVRLTFDSDWDFAKELMITVAKEETRDIIAATGMQPFIRAEFLDWGVLVRLRYNTIPTDRQEISTNIIEGLLREFRKSFPRVRFAIPASTVRFRPETGFEDPLSGNKLASQTP